MATNLYTFCSIFFIIIAISHITAAHRLPPADLKKVYTVFLKGSVEGIQAEHLHILKKVVGSEAGSRLIYSYRSFNAFSAKLTLKELDQISKLEEVAYVTPEKVYHLDDPVQT